MNIGIVTTWFERGAAYVSKQFEEIISVKHNVFIYARGGEKFAINESKWDKNNVTWGKRRISPFSGTLIDKKDFYNWVKRNHIDLILFNEQEWWYPLLWCEELKIPTIAYIDYYKKNTIPLYESYSSLICNTKRHYSAFDWHEGAYYLPWGTDCKVFKPIDDNFSLVNKDYVTFFHSCGLNPYRKGTDILLKACKDINDSFKIVIHSQLELKSFFDDKIRMIIEELESSNKLEIITKTVSAPGLYHLGDVYVYPSRLEGIGLTLAESEACGLVPVTTNNGPMNEFVNTEIGFLIDVKQYYSREDGYYWPECQPDVGSLKEIIIQICRQKDKIEGLKKANWAFANEDLNWEKNSEKIFDIIEKTTYKPVNEVVRKKIVEYESVGFRKFNLFFLKYYRFFSLLNKILKKFEAK
jgi:glycosyltransferase involved in cell wall biosynthesis